MTEKDWLLLQKQIATIAAATLVSNCTTSAPIAIADKITYLLRKEYQISVRNG
jgi:hypothetical protein